MQINTQQNKTPLNDYSKFINFYTEDISGTGYLAFRDLASFLLPNEGKKVLDFGCGAGRSTTYLKRLGLDVTGVDINSSMINTANRLIPNCKFIPIAAGKLPFKNESFDIVFNSFVLFDMPTKQEIILSLKQMKRVCKKRGRIISIINSDYLFSKKWLTIENNFPQNLHLKSGDIARVYLTDVKINLYDYYWTSKDYEECFSSVGFSSINLYHPMGNSTEGYQWKDELYYPPYTIYICDL